jgi:hypothetical protein
MGAALVPRRRDTFQLGRHESGVQRNAKGDDDCHPNRDRQRRPQLALAGGLLLRLRLGGLALLATRPLFGLLGGIDGLLRALPLLGHRSLPWGGCHPARSLDHAWIMQ